MIFDSGAQAEHLPTANIESVLPLRQIILASFLRNTIKMLLKNGHTSTVYYILREHVIYVCHGKNGPTKQANIEAHIENMIVELLRVLALHCVSKHLTEPRQQLLEVTVA